MNDFERPAIRMEGLTAGTGDFRLGPLDVSIPRGTVTAVVGSNGSGKSTLFRALLGLEPLTGGALQVLDSAVGPSGDERYKARIGFVAENPHAYENSVTVREKAEFASMWYPGWSWERYRRLMERFDIRDQVKLSKLSKGLRRKAELAVSMVHDPELLILDEPTSGLDPVIWKVWLEEMQAYMDSGDRTVLIATHVTEEVKRLADYVLILHRGKCLGFYEKDRLFEEWRTVLAEPVDGRPDTGTLRRADGCSRIEELENGLYRIDWSGSGAAEQEAAMRACGLRPLDSRRLELEEILSRFIQEEKV
ncbi:ABC transporter ATP-binding protein [Cohnella caldifontis]|uniref:ABC transporter ATP-binding protein n=1 Tax=Cohnella caldifontis TaxID=3027471 RepID=UPI0023EDC3B4|nr:ABC transporter ATP-binding protein [Cohnella sp. YIM B05605]